MKILLLAFVSCLLVGCSPTTHEGFVHQADAIFQSMLKVCKTVEHPQDFSRLVLLKPHYKQLAELMMQASEAEEKDPQIFNQEVLEAPHAEELKTHLIRIYALEGGKQAVEGVAREGLALLQKAQVKKSVSKG